MSIGMERKGYELKGWYTHCMTLSFDLRFSRSNFENAVSQEWGRRGGGGGAID